MEIHESFEPIVVAECEDDAAGDVNNGGLRLLDEAFSPLRGDLEGHRGALEGHRGGERGNGRGDPS